ncbi:MAG: VOC family protein [Solirubrobacteraceae bacterium]|jgi:predicted enzyme related to lactoylglutathione lyase
MPQYAPGTPSWIDLASPDIDVSVNFYSDLMGWTATDPQPETGGYRLFQQGGANVAGVMPHMQSGQPTAWATYVTVADADQTAATVVEAGGTSIVEPMDVTDIGRMAVFSDPTGAVFGIWQPKTFTGADLVNEPNSLCWNEVRTRHPERAKSFYAAVFGWAAGAPPFEGPAYTIWELDGRGVGGMMAMTDDFFPAEVPPHWSVCFAVADCDAIVARAAELGATVTAPATDMPIGRFAGFVDPQGAAFTVMQMAAA